jgi:hypothetical protein
MQDFEKLGVFYLGREYDPDRRAPSNSKDNLILYDSKDLVTHAVCVGMTGSGKTGLCLNVIEEAAIDSIPVIAIDPKGDLSNLLLTFPQLRAEDFLPWINPDDAARVSMTPEAFAADQAHGWKNGLAAWGQDGARIQRLKDSADFSIYTPGSAAGLRVSILRSFAAPAEAQRDDREAMRDRVSATATALLALLGIDADPVKSREHILLSNILDQAWRAGQDLDLGALIQKIQKPPFARVGVLDLEAFYPAQDRFELAMSLNNLLASPGFEAWLEGEPLDIGAMLRTAAGKPRITIFSIAHLNDTERMFFVALLLNEILHWTRTQSGTTSLRALIYMDEIFGYFPPVRNPPSKGPLLTLLKQARAFGVGLVLATQNPVDLDYKGLANAGTWFIGRLQTERDKARLMDGLESAAEASSARFDRGRIEKILASLGSRKFLMNNVHEDAPVVFESRWALSYLRGPLTRAQIKRLMEARPAPVVPAAAPVESAKPATRSVAVSIPSIPPAVEQVFLAVRGSSEGVLYHPAAIGSAQIHFIDDKCKVDKTAEVVYLAPITDEAVPVKWEDAVEVNASNCEMEKEPAEGVGFTELPGAGAKAKNYEAWKKAFATWVFANQRVELWRSPSTGEVSRDGENERDFRARLQQAAREERDAAVESLRKQYAAKLTTAEERIRRAQQDVQLQHEQAQSQGLQTALSVGGAVLGAFFGRKTFSRTNITAATSAARAAGRTYRETQDVGRAEETLAAMQQQYADLQQQLQQETAALQARIDPSTEQLEKVTVRPKKTNITVRLFALAWAPYRSEAPAWE